MTDEQRQELRNDLRALVDGLTQSLRVMTEQSAAVDLDQPAVGRLSRMDAIQQQQMAGAQRRRIEHRLRQVIAAQKLADTDEYGECRRCGDAIAYARLKAKPESPYCVPCVRELGG